MVIWHTNFTKLYSPQTVSRSVQPFLQGSRTRPTDRQTEIQTARTTMLFRLEQEPASYAMHAIWRKKRKDADFRANKRSFVNNSTMGTRRTQGQFFSEKNATRFNHFKLVLYNLIDFTGVCFGPLSIPANRPQSMPQCSRRRSSNSSNSGEVVDVNR